MGEIEFDFCAASQVANQVKEVMNRMNAEVLPEFEELMQELAESWNGEAGACFQELAEREALQMRQTIKLLEYADGCMQEAILTAERTEENTKEIAESRTY